VRKDKQKNLWPLMAAAPTQDNDIRKYEEIGTHPAANHNAISAALAFHQGIGVDRKVARLRYLRDRWAKQLLASSDRVHMITEIGPTGYGKTTLAVDLLNRRKYVMAFGTKREDSTLEKLIRKGYKRVSSFSEVSIDDQKIIIWPKIEQLGSADEIALLQRNVFREALFDGAFRQGRWTVYLDELRYITSRLGLASEVELLWEQGRSEKVSVVAGYQRPRNIPLLAYDQPEHLFFFKETDYENLNRMAETVAWIDRKRLIGTIAHLPKYDFVYLNKKNERAIVSRVEA